MVKKFTFTGIWLFLLTFLLGSASSYASGTSIGIGIGLPGKVVPAISQCTNVDSIGTACWHVVTDGGGFTSMGTTLETPTGIESFFDVFVEFDTSCAESIKSKIIYASEISDVQAATDASLTRTVRGNIRDEVSVLGKVLLYAARCTVKRGYTSPGDEYESFSLTARIVTEDGTKLSVELVGPAIVAVGAEAKPLAAPPRHIEKGINRTHKLATSWAKIKAKH